MTASRDITKDNPTMAASFLEKIISKLHEEGRYPKGLFDSPSPSPVCCNKQSIHILHLSIIYHHYHSYSSSPYALWGLIVIGFRLSSVASTVAT